MELLSAKEIYSVNEVYAFKVKNIFDGYCELLDEKNGFNTYLQAPRSLKLFKGQTVECRIKSVSQQRPQVELVNLNDYREDDKTLAKNVAEILKSLRAEWDKGEFTKLLIEDRDTNSLSVRRWIQGLINRNIDLSIVRTNCSDFLERTDFMNKCKSEEREFYQEKLTYIIEQLGYYIRASRLIRDESDENAAEKQSSFIDGLLEKLRLSGYVYHPNKNFNILSCLFLQKPEIMDSCINELLAIELSQVEDKPKSAKEQPAEKKSKPKVQQPAEEPVNEFAIRTSRIRKNVLNEYDDAENYVAPIFYFKFLDGCKIQKLDEYDYDTKNSLLTLTVLEPEEHGYLVLGYENGHIAKVQIDTTKDFGHGSYSRYDGSKLIFATVAGGGDAVLTITADKKAKSKPMMRLDHLKSFDPVGLNDNGECPFNESLLGTVLAYDVIPSRHLSEFEAILDKPKTFVGAPATPVNKAIVSQLHLLGISEI